MTPQDVLALAKEKGVKFVDFKFTDLPGMFQHFTIPVHYLSEDTFEDGLGFDGSSIRGFQQIHESDMLLFPDPSTAILDPGCKHPTLSMICNVKDPITLESYGRDARYVGQKAVAYMQDTGIADKAYFGPEAEFFVFDDVRYKSTTNGSFYKFDSAEGNWNSDREEEGGNLGYKPRPKEGYFPVPPSDTLQDLRSEMVLRLLAAGIDTELHHHEVAQGGQCEIDIKYNELIKMADSMMYYKYIIKTTAREFGKMVTFMPKPLYGDNGSGMHTHQSIWKGGKNVFYDPSGYANFSEAGLFYIGGLMKHLPALCALIAPTTNSYKRLVPGYEAPVNIAYSQRNRSACIRIPTYSKSEGATRMELRTPDPACNPYIAFAAMLMAGLDGIKNRTDPGEPVDKNLYDLDPEILATIPQVPDALDKALLELEADHDFLLEGDVFTTDFIENYIDYKRTAEVDAVRLRPHPHEIYLYHDI
ncbi:MAG: type I glutamate--ammonia ligase [Candidatus Poribacteria bacterium]|nr:type I glutamate--ammonia ligase [Candidatus Poribacteria bacterium]